jgi:hypothetical protein
MEITRTEKIIGLTVAGILLTGMTMTYLKCDKTCNAQDIKPNGIHNIVDSSKHNKAGEYAKNSDTTLNIVNYHK